MCLRWALLFTLLISVSHPAISGMSFSGLLYDAGAAHATISAEFDSMAGKPACLILSGDASRVIVLDRSGLEIAHTATLLNGSTIVCATVPADYLEFAVESSAWTSKSGSEWDFDLSLGSSENISSFNATLALPPGTILKGTNGAVSGTNGSLLIAYRAGQIDTEHRARMKASYELSQPAAQASAPDYSILIWLGLLAIGILIASRFIGPGAKQPAPQGQGPPPAAQSTQPPLPSGAERLESNAVFRTLDETDKEILREIARHGGKTTQATLFLNTHVPKATLSRRLSSLEGRGILNKSQKGNRNLVSLSDSLS